MNRTLSQSRDVQISVSLSKLIPSKRNPRRVKPERDAHRRMVASIRAHGLLAPLVVRADDGNAGNFKVIAGNRRLVALRDVYRDAARPPKVPCVLRAVDDDTADALALAENFVREPMHPLDESESLCSRCAPCHRSHLRGRDQRLNFARSRFTASTSNFLGSNDPPHHCIEDSCSSWLGSAIVCKNSW